MNSRLFIGSVVVTTLVVSVLFIGARQHQPAQRPNVLFICIDDLRPDLACYGNPIIHSPNLDRLAKQSALFMHQYVTQPTCGASRYSLLTGRLPRNTVELTNEAIEKEIAGKPRAEVPETFIDNLRRNGYYTVGIGKISHSADGYVYKYEEPKSNVLELPHSWDEMLFDPGKWKTGWNAFFAYADGSNRQSRKAQVKPYESAEVDDEGYPDGLSAKIAVAKLKELSARKQPFFLSVGFFKPHLPFNAPRKYWDLYDETKIPLTPSPAVPEKVSAASLHESAEFNGYKQGDEQASLEKPVSDAYARKLRHAYYAGVSYTDAQVGKVLDALAQSGMDKNTIVIVWSDHGWHLGDYRVWGKHTIFDQAVRSVLMVKTPAMKNGLVRKEVVSSVDIYPTLMELCNVKAPTALDGKSFGSLLKKGKLTHWDNVAYSYFKQGITLRTDRYRLTKYFRTQEPTVELYDHQNDPNENHNVAGEHPDLVKHLSPIWDKGNTGLFN
ncbi:sulfatase [Spirosoma endbachense]|uniref:Sulfatase-like hydrolase/transferase n=1 Tax=Spirosoma endbachense TaxID=2666025 RepID=A0A6P1W7C4_9BACT|nr:sulfatase [Spirosoma endbachense]QHW00273.1 sulfatase-like hydrolase/transferase [Spirosoma endbachense]